MRTDTQDGVVTLTFDHPERLNAVTTGDLDEASEAIERASKDDAVRVVVLAGDGRAFCSGADIGDGTEVSGAGGESLDAANRLVAAIVRSPKIVVAQARGVVAGVGVSIALAADLVLLDEDSYLLLAFTRIGLMPDGGATALVAASIGRARALRLALLAERLPASEALAAGLVTHVWPTCDYDAEVDRVVGVLRRGPAVAYARTKAAINDATLDGLDSAFAREREGQVGLLGAPDFAEGTSAFRERRAPRFNDELGR